MTNGSTQLKKNYKQFRLYLTTLFCFSIFIILNNASASEFSGYTEPYRTMEMPFGDSGIISAIYVQEGDTVTKDQILAELNHAVLDKDYKIAEERYTLKEQRYEKLKKLANDNIASTDELEKARAESAIEKYTMERIEALIEQKRLRSAVNGIVTDIKKEVSEGVAGVDTPVISVVEINKLLLNIFVDFNIAQKFKAGDAVQVYFQGEKDFANGIIEFISPDADKASRTVRVKILINNPMRHYASGILGKVIMD